MQIASTPSYHDTRPRIVARATAVRQEAQYARERAAMIARVGGHPDWWQDRAARLERSLSRLEAIA